MFLLHRPTPQELRAFLDAAQLLPLSYEPQALPDRTRGIFRVDEIAVTIGHGARDFDRATTALARWAMFDTGWTEIAPAGAPIEAGTTVVVVVRHLGFWSMNGCRVLGVSPAADADAGAAGRDYRFTYGTLTNHAERGEETFAVTWDPRTDAVTYRLRAISTPRAMLARLGWPVTRRLQARFRRDSARAMARAVRG